jgi:hypothetical protein
MTWIYPLLALGGGSLAWWVDSRNDEPQAAVLVILCVTFLLGVGQPRKAWLWSMVVGMCVPGGYLVAQGLGMLAASTVGPGWFGAALALIPAFIGATLGLLGRMVMNQGLVKSTKENLW